MDKVSSGCYVVDDHYRIISVNDTAKAIYPQLEVGKICHQCLMGLDEPCGPCPIARGIQGPNVYTDPIRGITESVDSVEVPIEGHGLCHALVFSTVGQKESFAATLPKSSEELVDLALFQALTVDFCDVFSVHVPTESITVYRLNNQPADEKRHSGLKYTESIHAHLDKYVYEPDRNSFRTQNDLQHILKRLGAQDHFINHYRVVVGGEIHHYYRMISRIGDTLPVEHFIIGVSCEDEEIRARRERRELERSLAQLELDSLTGLYTREAFIRRSERLLRRFEGQPFDFCIASLDNRVALTYQYGAAMVDRVLGLIGRALRERSEDNNCIGYLGHGVFASFTPNDPRPVREAAVLGFRDEILSRSDIKELSLKWSVYTNVGTAKDIGDIIDKTTYALTVLRRKQNQDYIEFDLSVIDRMDREARIEREFESAMSEGEFVAYYQPKYAIKTGKIAGAEALVRWIRPDGEMISPAEFIPVLENAGKIDRLDEFIFRETCRFKKRLAEMGLPDLPISVNLSRASLFKTDIPKVYSSIADEYGADKAGLPIEITESAAVRASSLSGFAKRMIAEGFHLHMDDFGAGYSSLASLQIIPFECIKLDKSLIGHIGLEDGEKLIKHTVAFAKECGKQVVAEGVESYEQLMYLKVIGCDYVQGYYFAKPMSEEAFIGKLKAE